MAIHTIERLEALNDVAVHQGRIEPFAEYYTDVDGNPTGGRATGQGFEISWQNGVKEPNGAIVEDVIAACIDRYKFFQDSKFACEENADAINFLTAALEAQARRTNRRKVAGTEGTYETDEVRPVA